MVRSLRGGLLGAASVAGEHLRIVALGAAILSATLIASAQPPARVPRLEITPDTVLRDERFRVTLDGLEPGQEVTLRVDGLAGVWRSSAVLRADDRGRIEVQDPTRFIWSAAGEPPPPGSLGSAVQRWTFAAEAAGGVVASGTLMRRAVSEDVRLVPVRERGLLGVAYFPPGDGPLPAMIVLPGAEGGIPSPAAHAGGLARTRRGACGSYRCLAALDPLSRIINTEVGRLLYFARDYEAAIAQLSNTLELDPEFAMAHLHLGSVFLETRRFADAMGEFRKAAAVGGFMPAVNLARAHALAGDRSLAEATLREMLDAPRQRPYALALLYVTLGDHERAIDSIERGLAPVGGGPWFLAVNPPFDPLRSHPRYQDIMRRLGIRP